MTSCQENRRTIIVNTKKADGVSMDSKLDINGLVIGQVIEMELVENSTINLIIEIENKDIKIPVDSKFYLKDIGLMGGKSIGIKMGSEKDFIQNGMTVSLASVNPNKVEDKFSLALDKVMSVFSGQHKTDSLLYELRRLNQNIEELNSTK